MTFEIKKIGEVANVISGFAFKSSDLDQDNEIPVIKIGNIQNDGSVDFQNAEKFPEGLIESKHEKFRLQNKDIILAMTGATAGKAGRINGVSSERPLLNQRVAKLEPISIDKEYFWQIVRSSKYRTIFSSLGGGAAQPNFSGSQIEGVEIPVPDETIQKEIGSFGSTIDVLIQNNRRRIALLEESARLLYREWFVSQDQKMKSKPLKEVANLTMGQSPASKFYNELGEGLPFHQGVTGYGFRFVEDTVFSTQTTKLAHPNDILLSVRAPVGRINITKNKINLGRGLAALNSKSGANSFLFYALKSFFFKEDIIGTGSIYAATTKRELEKLEIADPPQEQVDEFEDLVSPIDKQISNLDQQIQRLVETRDLLLPRLIDGRVAV